MNIHQVKNKIRACRILHNVADVEFEEIENLDFDQIEFNQSAPTDRQFFIVISKLCKLRPDTNVGIFDVLKLLDIFLSHKNLEILRSSDFNFDFNTLHCLILTRMDNIEIDEMIPAFIHLSNYELEEFKVLYSIICKKLSHLIIKDLNSSESRTLSKILRKLKTILKTNMVNYFDCEVKIILMHCCYFIVDKYRANKDLSKTEKRIFSKINEIRKFVDFTPPKHFLSIPEMNSRQSSVIKPFIEIKKIIYQQNIHNFATVTIKKIRENKNYYAIKEYTNISPNARDIIDKEMSIMAKLSEFANPENCFMKIYDINYSEDKIYIKMDYLQFNLKELIVYWKNENIKPADDLLMEIISKLIRCFADLQNRKIYHRDIKPQNILISGDFKPKVIDFNASFERHQNELTFITKSESVKGTINYMAPELIELVNNNFRTGKFKLVKADVFSLGLTLWELISQQETNFMNFKEKNQQLLYEIEISDHNPLFKSMLKAMLHEDYKERFDFVGLLSFLDSSPTQFSQHNLSANLDAFTTQLAQQ